MRVCIYFLCVFVPLWRKDFQMKNKKNLILLIVLLIIIGFWAGRFSAARANNEGNLYSYMQLFTQILSKLEKNYVEEINPENLITGAIQGMLETLDPYTTYLTKEDFEELKTTTRGEFGGLGIHISSQDDYITVMSVIEGTPASRYGLMAGDQIIKVNDESTKGWSASKAAKNLRGPKGTKVNITIKREGVPEVMNIEIVRDVVKIASIPYVYKIKDDIGYIRITNFNATTDKDLHKALLELSEQNIKGLLLDLRSNPGGLLDQAVETVDEFLPMNKLVVYTKGRKEEFEKKFYTNDNYSFDSIPIIVLINNGSASASEIFAGSLQDWDKALIVGENSFGKGSVQQLFPLPMGNGIKITTSKYYIKSGRCIQKDRKKDSTNKLVVDSSKVNNKQVFHTVSGRVFYGGGGITPDIIIKQDTLSTFEISVVRKNLFFNFAVEYIASHDIEKDFTVTDDIFNQFVEYINETKIEYTEEQMDEAKEWLKNSVEYQIVSNKFGLEQGNKIAVKQDPQLQKALKLFEKFDTLEEMFAYVADTTSVNK